MIEGIYTRDLYQNKINDLPSGTSLFRTIFYPVKNTEIKLSHNYKIKSKKLMRNLSAPHIKWVSQSSLDSHEMNEEEKHDQSLLEMNNKDEGLKNSTTNFNFKYFMQAKIDKRV